MSMEKPRLVGERVVLRPFEEADIEPMIAIISDPTLRFLTGSSITTEEANTPYSPERIDGMRTWYRTINDQTDRLDLAITVNDTVIGEVVLNDWDSELNSCNFRVLMAMDHTNHGYGRDAIQTFITYALNTLNLHRIELEVYDFNPRARHVYESVGFLYEGTKRKAFRFDGCYYDIHLYAIVNDQKENRPHSSE